MSHRISKSISRRGFVTTSATALAGLTIVPSHAVAGLGHTAPSDKLNVAGIGIGGKGRSDIDAVAKTENIVALCDVDWNGAVEKVFNTYPSAKRYKDFRIMLDRQKDIDAVIIATPDHTHAVITLEAMKHGKHVYTEKPLTHSVQEARILTQAARKYKVATQMGNSGQASDGPRRLREMIWDEIARGGSDKAELRLLQTGANVNGLNVKYAVSGTAENGYDFRITENIIMDNRQASLPIKPIDDTSLEGDETIIITLLPDSAYSIDTNNVSKTIYIRDNELPDVQFSLPCSSGPESRKPGIEVILSRPFTGNVEVEYNVSGILAQNSGDDYKVISGKLIIPAGTVKMSLPLSVIDDNLSEDDETLIIEIVKTSNANIGLNFRQLMREILKGQLRI